MADLKIGKASKIPRTCEPSVVLSTFAGLPLVGVDYVCQAS